ncbi:hypothetical protein [Actinocatenispora rupis]|uniref:Uncharacterized protein n=1 Tax=Actinocatenispora rupis TaxID=519421 RepID=A0A8J3J4W5_9ACTN|nr:hypothetical protein [Actinocatenispora rupis]GID10224.1 hypothetical protein Aru02nite_11130 [Actinocatenispora rupis]
MRPVLLLCLPPTHRLLPAAISHALTHLHTHPTAAPARFTPNRAARRPALPGGHRWALVHGRFTAHPTATRHDLIGARTHRDGMRCAGGPIHLLNLDHAAHHAHTAALRVWLLYDAVTMHTPPAQPWTLFTNLHTQNPERYPLDWARRAFAAQPAIRALRDYDHRPDTTPVFGRFRPDSYASAHAELADGRDLFCRRRALHALVGDRLLAADGTLLAPTRETPTAFDRYADAASRYLRQHSTLRVVAVYYH